MISVCNIQKIIQMKVIKHLKHETPEHRLKLFFKQMPLLTRIFLPLIIATTTILLILAPETHFSPYSFLDVRPFSEMIIFVIVALTDFQREERKGSIFFIISYILKILIFVGFNKLLIVFFQALGMNSEFLRMTSYPLLYCFIIAYRDMIIKTNEQRYFLIAPFQIKNSFYPVFLAVVLELIKLRVDLFTAFFVSILITAIKLDQFLTWISKKIDKKILVNKAIACGMLPTGCPEVAMSQIDRVTTNHSIVLDQS